MCWQLDKLECSKLPVPTKGVYFLIGTGQQYHIVLSANSQHIFNLSLMVLSLIIIVSLFLFLHPNHSLCAWLLMQMDFFLLVQGLWWWFLFVMIDVLLTEDREHSWTYQRRFVYEQFCALFSSVNTFFCWWVHLLGFLYHIFWSTTN